MLPIQQHQPVRVQGRVFFYYFILEAQDGNSIHKDTDNIVGVCVGQAKDRGVYIGRALHLTWDFLGIFFVLVYRSNAQFSFFRPSATNRPANGDQHVFCCCSCCCVRCFGYRRALPFFFLSSLLWYTFILGRFKRKSLPMYITVAAKKATQGTQKQLYRGKQFTPEEHKNDTRYSINRRCVCVSFCVHAY